MKNQKMRQQIQFKILIIKNIIIILINNNDND
jgi:hypothetical protein